MVALGLMIVLAGDMRAVFAWAIVPAMIAVLLIVVGVEEPRGIARSAKTGPPIRLADVRGMGRRFWSIVLLGVVFTLARFSEAFGHASEDAEFVIIDTPGGDSAMSRAAHAQADLIVTPMNDSFVDFDVLGHVDPVTLDLQKPSIYSETVWEARKTRALTGQRQALDWIVLRNRLASVEARNRKRVDERLAALSRRVGFRLGSGLRDRVIYR